MLPPFVFNLGRRLAVTRRLLTGSLPLARVFPARAAGLLATTLFHATLPATLAARLFFSFASFPLVQIALCFHFFPFRLVSVSERFPLAMRVGIHWLSIKSEGKPALALIFCC